MFSVQIYTLTIVLLTLLNNIILRISNMWKKTIEKFEKYPSQQKVVLKLLQLGLNVTENKKICCGDVEINMSSLAKSINTDRRVIVSTIENILNDDDLKNIFANITPAGPVLSKISQPLGLGVIELEGLAEKYGILSEVSKILADEKISILQVYASDPYLTLTPHMTLVTDKLIAGDTIQRLLKIDGITKVSIY